MRNTLVTGLAIIAACTGSPGGLKDPPVLTVSTPARSTVQSSAGMVSVSGMVTPNAQGTTVQKVMVNDVPATLNPDGSFSANIQIEQGATLIHTIATDAAGSTASDTRSIEAGALHAPGSMVPNAITADISAPAFGKIANFASSLIKQENFGKLLAPMQPMLNTGGSCLGARGYIDNLTMTNAVITLVPVQGGLSFSAEIDGLDVTGHADFDVACISGSDTFEVTADKVVVSGTLDVQPNGMMGFNTTLQNPNVDLVNLNVSAGGLPGAILDLIDFNALASFAITKGAELFMGPMVNKALGALAGPQKLMLLGKTIDLQVAASAVSFTDASGLITLDTRFLIEGSENSAGFVYTDSGMPTMDPGTGLVLGLSNNLANEALQQLTALGMLNLAMPAPGGTFDTANLAPTSAPMISGDPADGKLKLVLPDMMATFTSRGQVVGKAALNASVELKVSPASNGYAVAIDLGTPVIYIDTLNDVANQTHLTNDDLSTAVKLSLESQIASISALLGSIPVPSVAGLQLHDLSMDSDSGYVMVKGTLQ
jgi:hypothetical protein